MRDCRGRVLHVQAVRAKLCIGRDSMQCVQRTNFCEIDGSPPNVIVGLSPCTRYMFNGGRAFPLNDQERYNLKIDFEGGGVICGIS